MIKSMTAFGSGKSESFFGSVTVELRSVNSRFLDVQFRLPDELRLAEQTIKERLSSELSRGKVEVRAHFSRTQSSEQAEISEDVLLRAAAQLHRVRQVLPETASPTLSEIMNLSGAQHVQVDPDLWLAACQAALEFALVELSAGRLREGQRLARAMLETATQINVIVCEVEQQMPLLLATQKERLAQKLRETIQNAFPAGFTHISGAELSERLASESSLFALRIDVAEELARLKSHLTELEFLLQDDSGSSAKLKNNTPRGSAGKRLDFLFQEMNREANTLGSKAGSLEMSKAAIDLKLLIEQMKEQAMNIE
ncbi:YicC/YloC family endoribonuclease [Zwartia sp.]|uniref:YicC/YloC family endoribonuclease n=1 Tax=Zwartia sp. TaxID=2978004 RepID=UPI003BAED8CA